MTSHQNRKSETLSDHDAEESSADASKTHGPHDSLYQYAGLNGQDAADYEPDPIFISSRREAKWILLMWVACFVWTMTVCATMGYPDQVDPQKFPILFGVPRWVAIGIGLPWLVVNAITIWFCLFVMEDGELEVEASADAPGQQHEEA
jgi:hypothetical protein